MFVKWIIFLSSWVSKEGETLALYVKRAKPGVTMGTVIKFEAKPISIDLFIERADNGTPHVTLDLYIYSPSLHFGLINR